MSEKLNIEQLAKDYENKSPREILELALNNFKNIAISFSGAEDVVLIDMAQKIGGGFRVFSLDTGRLHPETYQFIEEVRNAYNINIEVFFANRDATEKLVKEKGLYSFMKDGHKVCCDAHNVDPLKRDLNTVDDCVAGPRKDQSPGTYANV